jgi:alkaline phosphatase D
MKQILIILLIFFCLGAGLQAQQNKALRAGPMLGQVDYRSAVVWVELAPGEQAELRFWKQDGGRQLRKAVASVSTDAAQQGFNIVRFDLTDLDVNTAYTYEINTGKGSQTVQGSFTTKELWQWRKPAPDFSFLTGSCSYMNQPEYDRPGKPYGGDSSIFLTMAREQASFMLWLGDNWYTREVDYYSAWGLWSRAAYDRSRPVLQPFLKKMPHYAIWDDHDFGPNDMGKEFILKEESRKVFASYWANPSYGEKDEGIYSKLSYSDVDIFLLDDRTWRSSDNLADSVGGKPNPIKKMYGDEQMEWLKNALAGSNAIFKIIATGSQVLNPSSPFDCFRKFPIEYYELMGYLKEQKIKGILFLTGDRHHTEVIKVEGLTDYPLYDVTVSPLTSGTHVFGDPEKKNPNRVLGIDQKQNYGRVSVSGKQKDRKLSFSFHGVGGEKLGEWSVHENELR